MSKQHRPDVIERGIRVVVYGVVFAVAALVVAAAVVAVLNAPTYWEGAVIASQCAVGVTAAAWARRGPEAAMRGLLGKVAKWELADTRADLDVVGPITGDTTVVRIYDFDDEDSIPGPVDDEAQAVAQ